jgi:uncharacterized membrane protein YbhN (UPF0104 family)
MLKTPATRRYGQAGEAAPVAPSSRGRRGSSRLLAWAHNLAGTAILCGFAFYLWSHRTEFAGVLEVSVAWLALLVSIILATLVFNALQMWLLLRASDLSIGFGESFAVSCAAGFGNYMPMRTGTLIRAHYLKSVHGLRYTRFASIAGIRALITVFATGAIGLCGTLAVAMSGGRLSWVLLICFGFMLSLPVVAWVVRVPKPRDGTGRLRRIAADVLQGADLLREQPRTGAAVLIAVLLQQLSLMARFAVAATASGNTPPPLALLLLLSAVALFAGFAALTPGALGIREAAMGGATYAVGGSFSRGILLGTIDRAVFMAVTAVVGGACFLYVWYKVKGAARVQPRAAAP